MCLPLNTTDRRRTAPECEHFVDDFSDELISLLLIGVRWTLRKNGGGPT